MNSLESLETNNKDTLVSEVLHHVGNPLNFSIGGAHLLNKQLINLENILFSESKNSKSGQLQEVIQNMKRALGMLSEGNERIHGALDNLRTHIA